MFCNHDREQVARILDLDLIVLPFILNAVRLNDAVVAASGS